MPPRLLALAVPALLLAAALLAGRAGALDIPRAPDRRVNDYASALGAAERDRLEQQLAASEHGSSNQVVVAIFRSLGGESLEDYSIRLARSWRIGRKGLDNGVIFLIFLDDRKMRIEVGYGLEATLTDAVASSIIRNVVAPRFREGHIADGIGAGVEAIEQAIAGTYKGTAPAKASRPSTSIDPLTLMLLFVLVGGIGLAVVPPLFFYRGRRAGWTGGSGGWGGPMIGGGGGWSGGGDSSSGGFSGGGGGDFGGGGASGSW